MANGNPTGALAGLIAGAFKHPIIIFASVVGMCIASFQINSYMAAEQKARIEALERTVVTQKAMEDSQRLLLERLNTIDRRAEAIENKLDRINMRVDAVYRRER